MPILLHYKNFFFEQFIRSLTSKNKLFKFQLSDTNLCHICKVISNTEHALFFCVFPKYFIHALAMFLDKTYNQSAPQFIFLKETFYLFNIYYEDFALKDYLQLTQLILIAKERSLMYSKSENTQRWKYYNWFSQSLLITQFACKTLDYTGIDNSLIMSFLDYLLSYKETPDFFIC